MGALLPLRYRVRNYHWGSRSFLANLRGAGAPTAEPEAELWMGVHPGGESEVLRDGGWTPLSRVLAEELGEDAAAAAPFLLKVLAVAEPLSLQLHPDVGQAVEGYARESAAELAPEERSYRDRGAKSELLVALERVWALQGLRRAEEIAADLRRHGLEALLEETAGGAGEAGEERSPTAPGELLARLLALDGSRRRRLQEEVARALAGSPCESPDDSMFWVARLARLYPGDPAVVAPLLLNLVRLEPGQALFQSPRTLHCYLEGAGVEVMSSSDNVVRAGLTSKKVDVGELVRIADFEPRRPELLEPVALGPGLEEFACPAKDFRLVRMQASGASTTTWKGEASLILGICIEGAGRLSALRTRETLELSGGSAFAALPGTGLLELAGEAELYCATSWKIR